MLKRFSSLFPSLPSLGWIVLVWTMLAHASTGAFTFSVLGWTSTWLDRHAWAGFVAGFALLAWPDLKPWFSKWIKLPKTVHERLKDLEEQGIPARTLGLENDIVNLRRLLSQVVALQKSTSNAIGANREASKAYEDMLDRRLEKAEREIGQLYQLDQRLGGVESRVDTAETKLGEHRPWISDLERTLKATRSSLAWTHKELTTFSIFMCDVSALITEADLIHYYLTQVRFRYPESEAAKAPFSQAWWRPDISAEPNSFVTDWALSTIHHVEHCRVLAAAFHLGESIVIDEKLRRHVAGWNDSTPFAQCLATLTSQRAKLSALRQDYAANFSEKALSPTTS